MTGLEETRICGTQDIRCYNEAEDAFLRKEFEEALSSSFIHKYPKTDCNCLPACSSLVYDVEISKARYDAISLLHAMRDNYTMQNPEYTIFSYT